MDAMSNERKHRAGIELGEVKEGVYEKMDRSKVNEETYDDLEITRKAQTGNSSKENKDKTKVAIVVFCVVVTSLIVTHVTIGFVVYFGVTDGGWTSWALWGTCSVTCGGGLITRSRTCSNPQPSLMGKYCDGTSDQVKTCNNIPCSGNSVGFSVHRPYSDSGGHPLTFSTALYNNNDVFNMTSGEFVCQQEGLYFFINTLLRTTGTTSDIDCNFYKNDNKSIAYGSSASSNNTNDNPSGTSSILYHLKLDDRVYLGSCEGMEYMAYGSSFTGFLISPVY